MSFYTVSYLQISVHIMCMCEGYAVVQLVEALQYNMEGCGFLSPLTTLWPWG